MKPEWCEKLADEAIAAFYGEIPSHEIGPDSHIVIRRIARALLSSHQRGRREGMEEAASVARCVFDDRPHRDSIDWNDGFDDGTKAAEYAIRAKAQEVTE